MLKTPLVTLGILFALSMSGAVAADTRYTGTAFEIVNNTTDVQSVNLFDATGHWMTPWAVKSTFLLAPKAVYQNTLLSIPSKNGIMNQTSIVVRSVTEPRHYFIFASDNDSHYEYISGDIVDGLGSIFVKSWLNDCHAINEKGYDFCKVIINE